ncbi:MAG: methyltransferase type 11 [Chloroflexi bacterium HGW-Chloroflexi-3]|nr:MAG: methyltransferase type 11 [Chloroflexi bacterium HGW-Chloroflexi-3]
MSKLTESKKLNLGSGDYPKNGYVNVDFYSITPPDIYHDLEITPYPFPDNHFELIEADHVLEHLNQPFRIMTELYRISAKNGIIRIKVPHFSRGFTHADHKRGFDVTFPYYFDPGFSPGYQGVNLKLNKISLRWFAQPYLKKRFLPTPLYYLGLGLGKIFDFFANLSPWACSRIWCFWVGGFEEIEFLFKVIK